MVTSTTIVQGTALMSVFREHRHPVVRRGALKAALARNRRARYLQNNARLTCARRWESAGGKSWELRQSRAASASRRAPNAWHASALADDDRRARRGVTFSESTANGGTDTELPCQKVRVLQPDTRAARVRKFSCLSWPSLMSWDFLNGVPWCPPVLWLSNISSKSVAISYQPKCIGFIVQFHFFTFFILTPGSEGH